MAQGDKEYRIMPRGGSGAARWLATLDHRTKNEERPVITSETREPGTLGAGGAFAEKGPVAAAVNAFQRDEPPASVTN